MTGWENQETGDWGEAFVKAELAREKYSVIELKPDLGEEFLVEIEGRKAVAEGLYPRRALIQVKTKSICSDSNLMKVPIPLKAIVRWSAQPLPVFIVGVCGRDTPSLFIMSLDEVLKDVLQGRDPTLCEQEMVTVGLRLAPTLAKTMSLAIEEFTRTLVPDFESLSKEEIDANHFEILKEHAPTVYEKAVLVGWSVLWKSPRRPQFFFAMFRELTKRAKEKYAYIEKPVNVIFHVYRSLRDHQHNMAIAHVDWVDTEQRGLVAVKEVFEWAPFRVRPGHDNDESRRYLAQKTATVPEFVCCIGKVGTLLDGITEILLRDGMETKSAVPWDMSLVAALHEVDQIWNETPQAPTEFVFIDKFISGYVNTLDENRWIRDKEANISQERRERRYQQNIRALVGYYCSWPLLFKTAGWAL